MTDRFLTEPEVAEILRCSTSRVKRLRLSGRLSYLPGRPLLISESALNAFIAAEPRVATSPMPMPIEESPAKTTREQQIADARKWARQAVLLRRHSGKRP